MPDTSSAFLVQFDDGAAATTTNPPEVIAQLVHELAQPLGTIESIAYYLRMVLPTDDQRTHEQLRKIEDIVASMNGTLTDAVHFLRQAPLNPEVIDLHPLLYEALAERGHDAKPEFLLDLPDEPALVKVDAGQGRHLVRSLVSLFRAFTGRCEQVIVRTRREPGQVTLEFNAPGLQTTREEMEHLFAPFGDGFRDGAGLTLASARQIVESNGGRISARSDTGRGLSLCGAFPLAS